MRLMSRDHPEIDSRLLLSLSSHSVKTVCAQENNNNQTHRYDGDRAGVAPVVPYLWNFVSELENSAEQSRSKTTHIPAVDASRSRSG